MSPEPINILLVDDRSENLLALEEILRHPSRRLFRALSGNQALKLQLKHDFAVVILDVQMPEMDGYETAQLMRGAEHSSIVPIIFLTAGDRSEERTFQGYQSGAVDFLYKPINADVLESKVAVFVELHRKSQELAAANSALAHGAQLLRERVADVESVNRTLSHDLRAPLRSIYGFSRALAESLQGRLEPETEGYLGRILGACGRMEAMLTGLHELLRVSASGPNFEAVDSAAIVAGLLVDLGADIAAAGAEVSQDGLPTLRANRTLLTMVLQNLIANALKFRTERPPRVSVTAQRQAAAWSFSVTDNGPGIPADARDNVFKLFHRLVGASVAGAGVGLALCRQAVEKHGGSIHVEAAPDGGASFCFSIPDQPLSQTRSIDSSRSTSTGLGM